MRLAVFFVPFTALFPFSALARLWEQGDDCPDIIKTVVPGGGGWEYDPYDKNESWEERQKRRAKLPLFDTMASVHDALTSCPNVTGLDLRVTLLGCSEWPDRWNLPFALEGGDAYPPLKKLRLEGYNFGQRELDDARYQNYGNFLPWWDKALSWVADGTALKYVKNRALGPSQRSKTNLDLWFDAMDWSHIESLAILSVRDKDDSDILKMASKLPSLRKLELGTGVDTAMKFINELPDNSLTHFTKVGEPLLPLPNLLQHQGRSFQYLELRALEWLSRATPTYNKSDLNLLSQMAPNLSHLSISLHRNGTWPLESLEAIASLPSLHAVDLYFDMASECRRQRPSDYSSRQFKWEKENPGVCEGEEHFQTPFVTEESSLELFKYMREKNSGGGLTNVTFLLGEWTRPWDGPIYTADWLDSRRAKVFCSVEIKAEGEPWCVAQDGNSYWTVTDPSDEMYDDF